jgi:SAM-dependent methyltransferase
MRMGPSRTSSTADPKTISAGSRMWGLSHAPPYGRIETTPHHPARNRAVCDALWVTSSSRRRSRSRLRRVPLHPLALGFADVAEDYEHGRPGYPPPVIAAVGRALALAPGARVADVGAGTGKLSRALASGGYDVVAVEPLPALRERLRVGVADVEVLAGTAEALPLPDASVDAVLCADAFHWFDGPKAVSEFARVIRLGGGLALLWNREDDLRDAPPWRIELHALVDDVRPDHPAFTDDQGRGAVVDSPAFGGLTKTELHRQRHTDRERVVAEVASMSYVGGLPAPERRDVLRRVEAILSRHGVGEVTVPLRTTIWTARRA